MDQGMLPGLNKVVSSKSFYCLCEIGGQKITVEVPEKNNRKVIIEAIKAYTGTNRRSEESILDLYYNGLKKKGIEIRIKKWIFILI